MIELDFDKFHHLIPVVLQDADSDAVLTTGFMNHQAFEETLESGRATLLSRARQRLYKVGEVAGNYAEVVSIAVSCEGDALLLRVRVQGDGLVCHRGTFTCFTVQVDLRAARPRRDGRRGALQPVR